MNLNTIRLEGKMMNDHFYETCDRQGILVMAGWCCCSYWEQWRKWKPEDYTIAGESLRDQMRRLRNHPSILAFLYGSDNSPVPDAEKVYLKVLEEEHWPNPSISSAADRTTTGAGVTGVKMTGPYEYVAPNYWLEDHRRAAARSASTPRPAPARPFPSWPACRRCCPRSTSGPSTISGISMPAAASYRNVKRLHRRARKPLRQSQGSGGLRHEEPGA